ncbi:signal transduction histidine kinase [Paenibacillus phyllosphaerae]|uniref:histidine kinase n=1 Tax=Paenibacillus phyllosphaerae TaxID=274593 RepID=A0A7W5AVG3_9BACL|nr:HAMP domain-containing sensor histidine kinase [Paenibacillus phyllosphaerae]MBB3109505.1 signal transduction histidine kinase [Paenibacillus phyllosphaerae]
MNLKRERTVEVVRGIFLFALFITIGWSIAYGIINFVHERMSGDTEFARLEQEARMLGDIVTASTGGQTEEVLNELARLKGLELVFVQGDAVRRFQGQPEATEELSLSDEQLQAPVGGSMIQTVKRQALLGSGYMLVGLPVQVEGSAAGLLVIERLPGFFANYSKGLLTVYCALVVLVLIALAMRPWREELRGWMEVINAIRRIGKGDFTVTLERNRHMRGQFGELADSINDMTTNLSQMEEMRQSFISNVSHEIQSPLTSIRGFARALQEDGLEEEQRNRYYNIIETESMRLSKLSDNLLKLTSLDSDKHPFEPKPYRLDKQLRRMILACEPQWSDKDIVMDVELPELRIAADEDLLSQVWMNLLSNSIKFTPAKGVIRVHAKQQGDHIVVVLSDSGIGIAAEDVPHIFERFFKADKARDRSIGGSGLGLSIVKRILDIHGGIAEVASVLGQGTTFTVRLPAMQG